MAWIFKGGEKPNILHGAHISRCGSDSERRDETWEPQIQPNVLSSADQILRAGSVWCRMGRRVLLGGAEPLGPGRSPADGAGPGAALPALSGQESLCREF